MRCIIVGLLADFGGSALNWLGLGLVLELKSQLSLELVRGNTGNLRVLVVSGTYWSK